MRELAATFLVSLGKWSAVVALVVTIVGEVA